MIVYRVLCFNMLYFDHFDRFETLKEVHRWT